MNDKRDEVIEAARQHPARLHHRRTEGWIETVMADFAIEYAESRETALRRQIADELERLLDNADEDDEATVAWNFIAKLRGNK